MQLDANGGVVIVPRGMASAVLTRTEPIPFRPIVDRVSMTKSCGLCGEVKGVDEFHVDTDNALGAHTYCKACRRGQKKGESVRTLRDRLRERRQREDGGTP